MKKILVLCTGNSCRSQMAEGYLREYTSGKATVFSAGLQKHGVNPRAIESMREDGIDISHHTSNQLDEYLHLSFDYIITVCDHARENCPVFPGRGHHLHQDFPDPAKATGTETEIRAAFSAVREQIKQYCKAFADQYIDS